MNVLILDLFGVVLAFDEDLVYRRLAQHCTEPDAAFVGMRGLVSRPALIEGRISLAQLRIELAAEHGLTLSPGAFEAAWLEPYSRPMTGMSDLIDEVSKRHSLVLLSNVDRDYWQVVRASHPELDRFAAFCLSWESGFSKPDRRAFLRAIEAGRTTADRCIFIDDKAENIEAASAVGLRGHRFSNAETLREVLRRDGFI